MSKGSCHFLRGELLGAFSGPHYVLKETVEKMWHQWGSGKEPLSTLLGTRAPFSLVYGVAGGAGTLWERSVRLVLSTAEGRRCPAANRTPDGGCRSSMLSMQHAERMFLFTRCRRETACRQNAVIIWEQRKYKRRISTWSNCLILLTVVTPHLFSLPCINHKQQRTLIKFLTKIDLNIWLWLILGWIETEMGKIKHIKHLATCELFNHY